MKKHNRIKALGLFVVILVLSFGYVTYFVSKVLEDEFSKDIKELVDDESNLLFTSLSIYLGQAKRQGQAKVDMIELRVLNLFGEDENAIAEELDRYDEEGNSIREIITESVKDLYFNNIKSNNTDGLATKDHSISEDNSGNCVSFGRSRTFGDEMLMHANPKLALEAFTRIALGDVDNYEEGAIDNPIFFQFDSHPDGIDMQSDYTNIPLEHKNKLGIELVSNDMEGLKELFRETLSWETTFRSFEFVTPTYVFTDTDLANRPYIEKGARTGISKLAISVVFNYKTVIDNNPNLKLALSKYEVRRSALRSSHFMKQMVLRLIVVLLVIICYISMHYTNKLVNDED